MTRARSLLVALGASLLVGGCDAGDNGGHGHVDGGGQDAARTLDGASPGRDAALDDGGGADDLSQTSVDDGGTDDAAPSDDGAPVDQARPLDAAAADGPKSDGASCVDGGCAPVLHAWFVAETGDDAKNDGKTACTPFRTIGHCAQVAQPGDSCLIAGGTYRETVAPARSGSATQPITFAPASSCDVVTVDGTEPVTGWTSVGNNRWTAPLTVASGVVPQLFLDGAMVPEARWPNLPPSNDPLDGSTEATAQSGTVTSDSAATNDIVDGALTQPGGTWVGARVHIRGGYAWSSQTGTVTASQPGSITYAKGNLHCPELCAEPGSRYWLAGVAAAMDAPGEWLYDATKHTVTIQLAASDSPGKHTIAAKQRLYAFDLVGRSYVTVRGLRVTGATLRSDGTGVLLDGLRVFYPSHFVDIDEPYATGAYDSGVQLTGTGSTIRASEIAYSTGNGVYLAGSDNTVDGCLIHDVDRGGTYAAAVFTYGTGQTITRSTLRDAGRDTLHVDAGNGSQNMTITLNDLSRPGHLQNDVGVLYACCDVDLSGGSVDHNWLHDVVPKDSRGFLNADTGACLYLDNGTSNGLLHHNVVWNCSGGSVYLNGDSQNRTMNNLVYNNTLGPGAMYAATGIQQPSSTGSQLVNNILRGPVQLSASLMSNLPASVDPKFVAPSANDYALQAGSPAIDSGQPIPGITTNTVGKAPDIGAYEYGAPTWKPGCSLPGC